MRDLIVFGEDFGGLPSSTQHLITRLHPQRRILWINSIGLRKPRWCVKDIKRACYKLFSADKALQASALLHEPSSHQPGLEVVSLKTIPAPRYQWERRLATNWMASQLKPVLNRLQFKDPILWSSLPTAADLCKPLGASSVVYYCGDDFGSLAGVDHQVVMQHEQEMVNHADLIFAASETLCRGFPRSKTQLLQHGVDLDLFATPQQRAQDLPSGRPVAGFYGSLSEWLDYDMINQAARALPDWNFVFIGKNELSHNPFDRLDNIHLLGPRPHHTLSGYSQHWEVSLLPFLSTPQIKACSPLKLKEYIAAGSPIISTPMPALTPYLHQINKIDTAAGLVNALRQHQNLRRCSAHTLTQESWQQRAQFVDWMLELL